MTNQEAAYIAGFIDADGSISGHTRAWGRCLPQVSITNVDVPTLKWMQATIGCGTLTTQGKRSKRHHRPHHQLTFYSANAERLLLAVLPHLRVKRVQAELALMVLATRGEVGTRVLPTGVKPMREWCLQKISDLNMARVSVESDNLVIQRPVTA